MARQKRNWKKTMLIIAIVVVILTIAQLVVLGMLGGMGPLKGLKEKRDAARPGNGEQYSFEAIEPMADSPLAGRNICVLGSSVVFGSASMELGVGEFLAARFDCDLTKEAVGGTTLVDNGKNSYVQRLQDNIDPNAEYALFVCQLSTNDATMKKPLGEISSGTVLEDFDTATVTGAMEYIICYAQQTWGCPVVFFTGSHYDSAEYDAMVARLLELQEKWGIGVLNLWTDDDFNNISDVERGLYMADRIHPTRAGYRDWWGPELERQLLAFLEQ